MLSNAALLHSILDLASQKVDCKPPFRGDIGWDLDDSGMRIGIYALHLIQPELRLPLSSMFEVVGCPALQSERLWCENSGTASELRARIS